MLGIDFGTTRTVVASVDRGNYPIVGFETPDGDIRDWVPGAVALVGDRLVFGSAAEDALAAGRPGLRSLKRRLSDPRLSPDATIDVGLRTFGLLEVLTGFLASLRDGLRTRSTLPDPPSPLVDGPVAVGVPAHASPTARFLLLEAFRAAGFEVAVVLHEPSAAGFEYTHRFSRTMTSRRHQVLVWDLGGGTFDVSLIDIDDAHHVVRGTAGDPQLGGDDFDEMLAALVMERAGTGPDAFTPEEREALREEARGAKEVLHPNSRRIVLAVRGAPVTVDVADFYAACLPLVERAIAIASPLASGLDGPEARGSTVAGIHLVGGASNLPIVARRMRESFGRRVHRAPLPQASTAIGLAIALDPDRGFTLEESHRHGIGVYREAADGAVIVFDVLVEPGAAPSEASPQGRRYRARHTVGVYRFVEFAALDATGMPVGTCRTVAAVRFPLDAATSLADAQTASVAPTDDGAEVSEDYAYADGVLTGRLRNAASGVEATIPLSRAAASPH